MTDRTERREEIKLVLEYIKLAMSLATVFVVLLAGLQWRLANEAANSANQVATLTLFQRMTNEWRDHLKVFVEKPYLRPYFEVHTGFAYGLLDDPPTGVKALGLCGYLTCRYSSDVRACKFKRSRG